MSMANSPSASLSGHMGLQNLLNEPKRLKYESERVNTELEALVMENYKVFVENLTCSAHLQSEVQYLPNLCCVEFSCMANVIVFSFSVSCRIKF
jgi:hypothetical protein